MNRPKYKQLYLAEKYKVYLIFRLCPQAKLIYETHKECVEMHAIEMERAFIFGKMGGDA